MYFQGKSSLGKSYLARTIAQKVREYAEENRFKSRIYSASSSNPFDDYYGEDIILLDDIRPDSLRKADWLKLLDPINTSRMSARFTNKQVVPRLILITNTQLPEKAIMAQVGHVKSDMTLHYTHLTRQMQNQTTSQLNKLNFSLNISDETPL